MAATDALRLAVGITEILLALLTLTALRTLVAQLPWLVLLSVFFAIRGGDRIFAAVNGREGASWPYVLDAFVLATLILMLLGVERTTAVVRRVVRGATERAAAYDNALVDYRTLVRHRLANPLTAIKGGLETLRARPDLDIETRSAILEAMADEVARLEQVTLDPQLRSAEEWGADLAPHRPTTPDR